MTKQRNQQLKTQLKEQKIIHKTKEKEKEKRPKHKHKQREIKLGKGMMKQEEQKWRR